jgi:NAD(P)H-flavin reductase
MERSNKHQKLDNISDPMLPAASRIQRVIKETRDSFTIELTPPDDRPEFTFIAGQFNMLYVFGAGEVPISISGNPSEHGTLVHTVREVGTVTRAMGAMKRGATVGIRGPFGVGWGVEKAVGKSIVIIAGGIGLAPLRPVIYHILEHRDKYEGVTILYGARTPAEMLFEREVRRWKDRSTLIEQASLDPSNTVAMLCGPEIMMRFSIAELRKRGIRRRNILFSMERNMKCAVGFCGRCQYGPNFVCKDGPVFSYDHLETLFRSQEV